MAVILALPRLFDAVIERFADEGTNIPNVFGWKQRARQGTSNRIVWVPGDESDSLGEVGAARDPGRNPRSLATLSEFFTVDIEAVDPTDSEDERDQYQAARLLFDAWWRAVYFAARGTVTLVSASWIDVKRERRYGAGIRVVCALEAMIPDTEYEVASTETRALIDDEELDVLEQIESAPAPPQALAATTENVTLSGEQTIDGVDLEAGDRVLVKDQADGAENGVYVAALGAWSRAADELDHGYFVHVIDGDENVDAGFELTTADPIVVDTTPLTFERVSP